MRLASPRTTAPATRTARRTPCGGTRWRCSTPRWSATERVGGFYPSLYLNPGHSYEQLGDRDQAARYYQLAAERADELAEGSYADMVRDAITRGQQRISEVAQ